MLQATQFHYTARHKPNQLIYGTGQTAVITGWTVKQAIAKHLQPSEYAVIGQLYSPTRGMISTLSFYYFAIVIVSYFSSTIFTTT
jgi:hypothetical protein